MTTTKGKVKKLCWFGILVLADKALLPSSVQVDVGVYQDIEPVKEFDYRNRGDLVVALQEAFAAGNPKIDLPPETKRARTPMEIRAKAKSWADLERKSIYFSIECYPTEFVVISWGRAADRTWSDEEDHALDARVPVEQGMEGVADVILNHLKTRRDLPGLLSQSA